MGILDEAIREHLDLKRRMGAGEDELARLEDEAFGPPSRPGDPEFPETGAEEATGEEAQLTPEAEPPADTPQADVSEAPPEETPAAPEAEAPPTPLTEPAAPADEDSASGFYDAEVEEEEELELDLDLDIDDETESAAGEESAPISSLDTVEHHFEDAIDEAEVVEEEPPGPPTEEEEAPPAPRDEGGDEEGEDVLEDTPEFLQDTPEDDELWFEQGEPKDFDF